MTQESMPLDSHPQTKTNALAKGSGTSRKSTAPGSSPAASTRKKLAPDFRNKEGAAPQEHEDVGTASTSARGTLVGQERTTVAQVPSSEVPLEGEKNKNTKRRLQRVDFRASPRELRIASRLLQHRQEMGDSHLSLADVHREAHRMGLLLLAIRQGPESDGRFVGLFTGPQLAQEARSIALELADFCTRQGMPIGTSYIVSATSPIAGANAETSPGTSGSTSEEKPIKMVASATSNLRNLGIGTRKERQRSSSASSDTPPASDSPPK